MKTVSLEDLQSVGINLSVNTKEDCINVVPNDVLKFFATQMNPSPLFDTTIMLTTLKKASDEDMDVCSIDVDFDNDEEDGITDDNYLVVTEGGSTVKLYYEYMKYCIENPHCMGAISGVTSITFVLDDDAERFYLSKL